MEMNTMQAAHSISSLSDAHACVRTCVFFSSRRKLVGGGGSSAASTAAASANAPPAAKAGSGVMRFYTDDSPGFKV
jgi:hypothetical protein